ncbi:hypothetical protein SIN8267_01333 [Sinobacterium norvegicum]|uniref:DUF2878 domain-containing protein n=1 Tax=Sinobacterium norvegicum TaxID=1641715 RepID=A0ABM9ADF3_9GAMM|nr:DUF2878 domain-containing protein [Sinobacterium norvegicum]CAH0991231.1 hypothetical protein SIN8267_01333 [Sinobacterium norvegicum]
MKSNSLTFNQKFSELGGSKQRVIRNALLFQANWFICAIYDESVSVISTMLLVLVHFFYQSKDGREWSMILLFSLSGYLCDSLLANLGVIELSGQFTINSSGTVLAPTWLLFLWLSFATTINHCMAYLQKHLSLAVLLCLIAVPLNYLAGAKLTGSTLADPQWLSLSLFGVYWAVLLPAALLWCRLYCVHNTPSNQQA